MDLLELAALCEAATRPDGFLDRHIAAAFGSLTENALGQPVFIGNGKPGSLSVPRYTASLDAAMTLVPEGLSVTLYAHSDNAHCDIYAGHPSKGLLTEVEDAATPALALCAAALRARAVQTTPTDGNEK